MRGAHLFGKMEDAVMDDLSVDKEQEMVDKAAKPRSIAQLMIWAKSTTKTPLPQKARATLFDMKLNVGRST